MQDTTKVGKYIYDDIGYLSSPNLNKLLNDIIEKINENENQDERKAILKKIKLSRMIVFKDSAFIINHILNSRNYKERIIELSDKLDIFIEKDKIDYSTIIDFSNDLSSKMKSHAILITISIRKTLKENELREMINKINEHDERIIDRVLFDYRKWISKVEDDHELYSYLKEYEPSALELASSQLEKEIKKIEEEKLREVKLRNMELSRNIAIYNQKHKSIHRHYNRSFE